MKIVDRIFVFITSTEGTPLFRENDTFSGSRNLDLTSIQGTLNTQNVTDQENRSLIIYGIHSSQ